MLESYLAKVERCTTVNQFNRLHILLENVLAPAEVTALIDGVRARGLTLPEPARHWLARLDTLLRANGRRMQPYERRVLTEGAIAYAAPGTSAERVRRTLVFAFTDDVYRLMMPISLFLQHCPAARYEIVMLVDPQKSFFLTGVPGIGHDMPTTIARLAELAVPSRFHRAVSLGTSAGGLAALWTGVELHLARAVSVGGASHLNVLERVQTHHLDTSGFEEAIARNAGALPEVFVVSAEHNARDNQKAAVLTSLLPTRHITVPGASRHNVLYEVWNRGELDGFLEQLLGEGSSP